MNIKTIAVAVVSSAVGFTYAYKLQERRALKAFSEIADAFKADEEAMKKRSRRGSYR